MKTFQRSLNLKRVLLVLVLFQCMSIESFSLTYNYAVTSNSAGSGANTLAWAINQANAATAGNNVIITFNTTSLVKISSALPAMNAFHADSLRFTKDPTAIVDQGIEGDYTMSITATSALQITNSLTKKFKFENLTFKNLGFFANGILIQDVKGITFTNCHFTSLLPILINTNVHVDLKVTHTPNATFDPKDTLWGCLFNGNFSSTNFSFLNLSQGDIVINSCVFDRSQFSTTNSTPGQNISSDNNLSIKNNKFIGNFDIALNVDLVSNAIGLVSTYKEIGEKNIFSGNSTGLLINRLYPIIGNPFPIALELHDNSFSNCEIGLRLINPKSSRSFKIESNTFEFNNYDIQGETSLSGTVNPAEVSNLTLVGDPGTGNHFNFHSASTPSIYVKGNLTHPNYLLAWFEQLELKGKIICEGLKNSTVIKNNTIVSNDMVNEPIITESNAYANNLPPITFSAEINGGLIYVKYGLPNLGTANNPDFKVDFYKSNSRGDLLKYLGSTPIIISSAIHSPQDKTITLSAKDISPNDRLAATVTSMPSMGNPISIYGTSQATYCNFTSVNSCDFNDICNPVDLSCHHSGLKNQLFNCPLLNVWYYFNPDPGTLDPSGGSRCKISKCIDFDNWDATNPHDNPIADNWHVWSLATNLDIQSHRGGTQEPKSVYFLQTIDQSGPSDLEAPPDLFGVNTCCNDVPSPSLFNPPESCCSDFCFDFKIIEASTPETDPPLFTHGQFYILTADNSKGFGFSSNIEVSENSDWVHICAPITNTFNGNMGATGRWWPMLDPFTLESDWGNVISHVGHFVFRMDYSSYQSEVSGFDNMCFSPGTDCSLSGCLQSVKVTSLPGNDIKSVNTWNNASFPIGCDNPGNPDFTTLNPASPCTLIASSISQQSLIQIQLLGNLVAGFDNLYSYDLTLEGASSCDGCTELPCKNCIGSFKPQPGKDYILSAWVREESAPSTTTNFTNPYIDLEFNVSGSVTHISNIKASGQIIDGWQKIYKRFNVPQITSMQSEDFTVSLACSLATGNCLFDDVRIFPVNGMMKSYVYDPVTMRFVAELDEENYATFYEYDDEGKLTTIKKETERGKMTIKESRSKIHKSK